MPELPGRLFPGLGTGLGRVRVRQVNTVPELPGRLFPGLGTGLGRVRVRQVNTVPELPGRLFPGLGTGLGRVRVRQVNTVPYIPTEPLSPSLQFFIHTVCKKWREKPWCNLSRGCPPIINSRTTEQKMNLLFFCPYGYCPRVVRDCDVYLHTNTKYSI